MNWKDIHDRAGQMVELIFLRMKSNKGNGEPDAETRELLDRMENSDYWLSKLQERECFDYRKAFRGLQGHIRHNRFRRYRYMSVVAAACVFVVIGLGLLWESEKSETTVEKVSGVDISEKKGIVLTLNDGSEVELDHKKQLLTESKVAITIDSGNMRYEIVDTLVQDSLSYNILNIPRGGEYSVLLSDGTMVWLNAASRLKFPVTFLGNQRKVYLSGEAYFDVTANPQRPFIVSTEKGEVAVYGTQFNVKQYPEEKDIEVTLVKGAVSFVLPEGNAVGLQPGHRLVYDGLGMSPRIASVNVRNYVSWRDNVFCFEEESLDNIMRMLSRWYDVHIVFRSTSLKELKFTGNLNKYSDIHCFLRLFEASVPVAFDIQGDIIVVKEK